MLLTGSAYGAKEKAAAGKPAEVPVPQVSPDTPVDRLGLRLSPLTAEDLAAEAAAWQALLKAKTQEVVELRLALRDATGDEAKRLTDAIVALSPERGALSSGLNEILAAWEAKGGDPEQIEPLRKYVAAIAAEQIKGARLTTLLAELEKWLTSKDGGLALLGRIGTILVALAVLWAVAKILSLLVSRAVSRVPDISDLLRSFVSRAAFWVLMAAGLLIVLASLGVNVGGLVALVGGASFVIAFAMQSTLSNFAAGLMIMIYRPFDVGDHVDIAGVSGAVNGVSLVSTTVTTPDNRVVVIPNSNVWGSVITNATGSTTRRVDLAFSIGRQDDASKAQRILDETLAQHPLVLKEPAPFVRLREFGESSVSFSCEAWAKTADYSTVYWDLVSGVKERFDAAGVAGVARAAAGAGA
jgi:small conductance mechanosensitive channel